VRLGGVQLKPGDRVRWREQDTPVPFQAGDRVRGPDGCWYVVTDDDDDNPWIYGWVRYVFNDGTARIRADDGSQVDRHPRFKRTEPVSAVDALAALAEATDGC